MGTGELQADAAPVAADGMPAPAGDDRLGFRIGHLALACPRAAGREAADVPRISRVPNTPAWLLGLASLRGGLVPVADLARLLGVERNRAARGYLLVFGEGEQALGVLVDGLPGYMTFTTAEAAVERPPALREHVVGAYRHAGTLWLDLDIGGLLATLGARIAPGPRAPLAADDADALSGIHNERSS